MENQGASVVISHEIPEGKEREYEQWLEEIGPICRSYPGNIDWQIVLPIKGLTNTYTVIIRFDTIENLERWMFSEDRKLLILKSVPFLAKKDQYQIKSGLDFLFTDAAPAKAPVRWKQFLVTWSAIYPLSLAVPLLVLPILSRAGLPLNRYLDGLFISACIVFLMVYVVMPRYTKLIRKWLFN